MRSLVKKRALISGGGSVETEVALKLGAWRRAYFGAPLNCVDALIVRKEAKGHGTGAWLEGPLPVAGSIVTVLEDVVTTGGSSLKAVNQLKDAGYQINRVVTIVDREEGGAAAMAKAGLELVSLFRLSEVSTCAAGLGS